MMSPLASHRVKNLAIWQMSMSSSDFRFNLKKFQSMFQSDAVWDIDLVFQQRWNPMCLVMQAVEKVSYRRREMQRMSRNAFIERVRTRQRSSRVRGKVWKVSKLLSPLKKKNKKSMVRLTSVLGRVFSHCFVQVLLVILKAKHIQTLNRFISKKVEKIFQFISGPIRLVLPSTRAQTSQ